MTPLSPGQLTISRRPHRVARAVAYALFALAGIAAIAWPSPAVATATGWLVYVWAAFLLFGGTMATVGAVTDRWIGEYAGLPLLFSAFGVYSLVIGSTARLTSVAGAFALGAITAKLFARWQDVGEVRREATARARQQAEG